MERRSKQPGGRVTEIPCRKCGVPVMLDPRRMRRDGEHWLLTCVDCDYIFPVRLSDPHLPITAEMEEAARRQTPAKPKGNGRLRKFLVGH